MFGEDNKYLYKTEIDSLQKAILDMFVNDLEKLSKVYVKEIEKIFLEKDEKGNPKYYVIKNASRTHQDAI